MRSMAVVSCEKESAFCSNSVDLRRVVPVAPASDDCCLFDSPDDSFDPVEQLANQFILNLSYDLAKRRRMCSCDSRACRDPPKGACAVPSPVAYRRHLL